jgi:hypothetical protein
MIEQDARDPALEPSPDWPNAKVTVYESEIELSKAISLKRIADMFERAEKGSER